ncbi:hypothetical protein ACFQI3_15615 [Hansschlegelia quercus]|uniref:Uncharacterized protein n=1 Tax=Hansschlegelia quercus TaxID=2528245 RepID=A0A4Q9GIH3_9HYPH|nr:hypothetical protein [Hansschlegelia quercus]TBN52374.1 hypothetical protein EYR15_11020 [Hansschlegelia quercus]
MRKMQILALATLAATIVPASAQRAGDLPPIDVGTVVSDIGAGWVKKTTGEEGVTYVCESDACGGRGVVGIGQAKASPDYVKEVVADPEKTLKSYRYATDESMRPSGCEFKTYEIQRLSERRIKYQSKGACGEGAAAVMSTIFDVDRPGMISVQVLTKSEQNALKLRDASIGKLVAALDNTPASAAR